MTTFIKERFHAIFIAFYILAMIAIIGYSLIPFLSSQASVANDWTFVEPGNLTVGPSATNVLALGMNLPVNAGGVDSITDPIITDNADAAPAAGFDFSTSTWTNIYYADNNGGNTYDDGEAIISSADANLDIGALNGTGTDTVLTTSGTSTADLTTFAATDYAADTGGADNNNYYDDGEAIFTDNDGTIDAGLLNAGNTQIITVGDVDLNEELAGTIGQLHYYDAGGTGGAWDTGEDIITDNDNDNVYTSAVDAVADCDGTSSTTNGSPASCAAHSAGDALVSIGADVLDMDNNSAADGYPLCTDSLTAPTMIYYDTDADCDTDTGDDGADAGLVFLLGSDSGNYVGTTVTNKWAFADADADNLLDDGEDLYIQETAGSTTYTDVVDDIIYNGGSTEASAGNTLTALQDTDNIMYIDSNHDGVYDDGEPLVNTTSGDINPGGDITATDTILARDSGNWTMDWMQLSTDAGLGYCDNDHGNTYTDGEAIILDAGAFDTILETTDIVEHTGLCDLETTWAAQDLYHGDNGNYDGSSDIIHDDDTSGYYNGDQLTSIKIGSPGDCNENSINKITIWEDGPSAGWDGDEAAIGSLTQTGIGTLIGQTITTAGASVYTSGSDAQRIMVTFDTTAGPTHGCTFSVGMPTNAAVLVSNNDGPTDTNKAATSTFTIDSNTTVSDAAISIISNGSGLLGVEEYIISDALTVQWDDTIDSNGDIASATVDFTSFGGGAAVAMEDDGAGGTCNDGGAGDDVWCATYTIAAGAVDTDGANNLNVSVTANDTYGNTATTGDTTGLDCDNIAPTIGTPGTIALTDTSGEGVASIGETLTYAGGIPGVADGDSWSTDLSAYGGLATQTPGGWVVIANNDDGAFSSTETISDDAGNLATGPATITGGFTIDNIAPTFATSGLTIFTDNGVGGVAAVNGILVAADQVNVNATAGAADGDTITWDASPLGGGASATQANNTPVTVATGAIDNGAYAFNITITDNGGNSLTQDTNTIDGTTISLDNILPNITDNGTVTITTDNGVGGVAALNDGVTNQDKVTQSAVTLSAPDGDTTTIDITGWTGQAALAAGVESTVMIPGAIDVPADSAVITVIDNAGNATQIASDAISVDNIAPTFATSGLTISTDNGVGGVAAVNGGGTPADAVNVNATATVADTDTITWDASPLGGGASATQANNTPVTVAAGAIDNATYAFNVTITDNGGNTLTQDTNTIDATRISLDNTLPAFATSGFTISTDNGVGGVAAVNGGGVPADQININATVVAPDGDTITWNATAAGGGGTQANNTPVTVAAGAFDSANYNPTVTVTDNAGNNIASGTGGIDGTMISLDNILPNITSNGTLTITTDNGVGGIAALNDGVTNQDKVTQSVVTLTAADGDTETTNFTALTGQAALANGSESTVVIPGALDSGTQDFIITVTDNAGNIDQTTTDTISVDNIVPIPLASGLSISTDNGVAGVAAYNSGGGSSDQVTVNATVTAPDGDTITWDASGIGGLAAETNNTAVSVAVGAIDNAAYSFNLVFTDDAGNIINSNTNAVDGSTISVDNILPTIINTYSIDSDNDGDIDTFDIQGSENFLDASFNFNGFEGDNDATNNGVGEETASGGGTAVTQPGVDVDANDEFFSITLTNGITGTDLAYLNFVISFTTISDDGGNYPAPGDGLGTENDAAPAVIVTTYPANGATGVSRYAAPTVTFSEPMNTGSYAYAAATQPTGGYTLAWDGTSSIVTFNHGTAFGTTTLYDINTTACTGQDGAPFLASLVPNPFSFTTTGGGGGGGGGGGTSASITGSISINNGGTQTESNTVTLNLSTNGGTQMVISNDPYLAGASWETFDSTKTWELETGLGAKTVYVRFKNDFGAQSSTYSDSIEVVEVVTEEQPPVEEPEEVVTEDGEPAAPLPDGVEVGQLVKRPDLSAVYFIDNDNRRHAFPNETVFFSWFTGFDEVQTISAETLATIPLGSNVTMRPGTWMIKIQTDPKVYAVEPYGVIRWVSSEEIATSLYGPDWNQKIVDVDVTFFINYQQGSAITTPVHATGTLISYEGSTAVYYIDEGYKRYISSEVFNNNYFQGQFIQSGISTNIGYPDGDAFPSMTMDELMMLL